MPRRFAVETLGGIVFLGPIYLVLSTIPVSSLPGQLIYLFLAPLFNFVWIAACIAVSIHGVRNNMPGVAWSPIVFCVFWCSTSILHRTYLTVHATSLGIDGGPPAVDLREKTLSLLGPGECCWFYKALAQGKVARIVLASENDLDRKPDRERAITHAMGDDCHRPGQKISEAGESRLKNAGRLEECFIETWVVGIPDGLIVRTRGYHNAGYRTDFLIREGGRDTVTGEWVSNGSFTLSYLPLIGLSYTSSTGFWQPAAGGPIQQINNRPEKQSQRGAAIALFGDSIVEPIPPAFDPRGPAILAQAASLTQTGKRQDRSAALQLAAIAWQANNVNDLTYDIVAASACDYAFNESNEYQRFVKSLNLEESIKLLHKIFDRAGDTRRSNERGTCEGILPSAGTQQPAFVTAAKALFAKPGLGIWQYQFATLFLRCPITRPSAECDPTIRDELSRIAFSDRDPQTLTGRSIGLAKIFFPFNDEEIDEIARSIDVVSDQNLPRFASDLKIHYILANRSGKVSEKTVAHLQQAVKNRVEKIRDPRIKEYFKSWF